jgi:predicted nucleic acid-binding protein
VLYLDSSVLVAFYVPEATSAKADALIRSSTGLLVSDLAEVEVFSVLGRKIRKNELPQLAAHRVASIFATHLAGGFFDRMPLEHSHFVQASSWLSSLSLRLRTFDALHLAAAAAGGHELVTGDELLAKAAKSLQLPHRFIRP